MQTQIILHNTNNDETTIIFNNYCLEEFQNITILMTKRMKNFYKYGSYNSSGVVVNVDDDVEHNSNEEKRINNLELSMNKMYEKLDLIVCHLEEEKKKNNEKSRTNSNFKDEDNYVRPVYRTLQEFQLFLREKTLLRNLSSHFLKLREDIRFVVF